MSIYRPFRSKFRALGSTGGLSLPNKSQLLIYAKRYDAITNRITDTVGQSERDPLPLQYIQADGTGYFVNADMVSAGRTITNITKNGTSTVTSPSAGRVNMTAGTCWDFTVTWSDGPVSNYQFASKTGASAAIAYDVSSNGRHLTATGFSNIDNTCASGYTVGSDHCTLVGYTSTALGPVPAQTANPYIDAIGNTTQYPGRAKYSIKPVQAVCATFATGTSLAVTNTNGVAVAAGSSYVNAGTATVTIGTNSITYLTAGTVYNLRITSNGRTITIPFIEGAGTTAYGYDDQGGIYQCAITDSDINAFWAGKQDVYHHGLQYGYRLSGSAMIPANPYAGLACDGNALTAPAGIPNASCSYKLPACDDCITAYPSGYTGSTPNAMTLAQLQTMFGNQIFFSSRGFIMYSGQQSYIEAKKVHKILSLGTASGETVMANGEALTINGEALTSGITY